MNILAKDFKNLTLDLLFNLAVQQRAKTNLIIELMANDEIEIEVFYQTFDKFRLTAQEDLYRDLFVRFAHLDLNDLLSPDKP